MRKGLISPHSTHTEEIRDSSKYADVPVLRRISGNTDAIWSCDIQQRRGYAPGYTIVLSALSISYEPRSQKERLTQKYFIYKINYRYVQCFVSPELLTSLSMVITVVC